MFGLLLMIAIYECSRDILALKNLLKMIDCDGPTCQQLIPLSWDNTYSLRKDCLSRTSYRRFMRMSSHSIGKYLRIPIHHKVSCAALTIHALNSCDSRNHVPVPSVRCSHTFACVKWKLREDNQSPKIRGFRGLAETTSELLSAVPNSFLHTIIMQVDLVAPDDVHLMNH